MRRLIFILVIALIGDSTTLWAQGPALPVAAAVIAAPGAELEPSAVRLLVGRSTVVDVGSPIVRVSLTSADVADALVTSPSQLLVNGKMPGTISMFVWDRAGAIRRYEVVVQRDLSRLSDQLKQLFPAESISVQSNGRSVVLSGQVLTKDTIEKAVNLASGYVDKKEEVVSLLQLQANGPSNQVLLRVRFAEVSRNALTELGASLFTGASGYKNYLARSTTQQFAAPDFQTNGQTSVNPTHLVFSDFLNLFLFDMKDQLGLMIKDLQSKGLFQSLAEPNLVAESGKEASFLAGGEFPIPVAQGSAGSLAITVTFKEFGVRLNFTPIVEGNRVHLKVRPEVSTLDFNNAVVLNGFRIPALTTRRTETELELENGQTFAIAGLLNNTMTKSLQKIPGIGDIPILGLLFKSEAAQKDRTELVVMITPQILPRNSNGVVPDLPRLAEPYLPPLTQKQSIPSPPAPFRDGQVQAMPAPAAPVAAAPSRAPSFGTEPLSPSDAARTVSALTPGAPRVLEARPTATVAPPAQPTAKPALAPDERKALEHAQQQEREAAKEAAKLDLRLRTAKNQQMAKQVEIDRRNAAKEHQQQESLARTQAKRDAETAKQNAKATQHAQEAAKRQAEIDRRQQKVVEDAATRLKAAEVAYEAEVAKKNKSQE